MGPQPRRGPRREPPRPRATSVRAVAPDGVEYIFSPLSAGHIEAFAELLRPGGHITAIDEPEGLDLLPFKSKSIGFHWELMFTRPLFEPESTYQRELRRRGRAAGGRGVRAVER